MELINLKEQPKQQTGLSVNSQVKTDWIKDPKKALIYSANFGQKIQDFTNTNQYADLVKVISEWRLYLGIKDEMTDVELELNTKYLKEEYGHFSLEKIRLAIKYSLKGELKVDIKPYGSFSPLYISTILNAYEAYNNRIVSDLTLSERRRKQEEKNKPVELTAPEKIQSRRVYLKHFIESLKNNDVTPFYDKNDIAWNFLTRNKLVDPAHLDRFDLKSEALKLENANKNPFELTSEASEIYVKHLAMKEYLLNQGLNIENFTDEEIML